MPFLKKVVVGEDEDAIAHLIEATLGDAGWLCLRGRDGEAALALVREEDPDLLILDVLMPRMDGLETVKRLKADPVLSKVPVLMLTSLSSVDDKVRGLSAGADDYLGKPFDLGEVEARLRALVRRASGTGDRVEVGELALDRRARRFFLAGEALALPAREFEVLSQLMTPPGRVVSKRDLSRKLSDADGALGDNALEAFVSRLRRKLAGTGAAIRTLRGLGYMLEEDAGAP
jgi:two-component system, OmpR family, response regulator